MEVTVFLNYLNKNGIQINHPSYGRFRVVVHYGITKEDVEYLLKLIVNNGFPLVLSAYLVWELELFINEITKNQKEFSHSITAEIKKTINELRVNFAKNQ